MPAAKKPEPAAKRFPKKTPAVAAGRSPSELIDERIAGLQGWRGEVLARLRAVIQAADPAVTEEWKWNTPVWSCSGIVCTGETYKKAVKLTFAKGASIADPARLFNSSLDGSVRRAIDFKEGGEINAPALEALVQAAVRFNRQVTAGKAKGAA